MRGGRGWYITLIRRGPVAMGKGGGVACVGDIIYRVVVGWRGVAHGGRWPVAGVTVPRTKESPRKREPTGA